ncbi:MAG: MFS transporter [Candidatus Hydrogenedentes bacterium]|nr:MFS transporter [Candidatus Hydrogenedentota bacterium]
MRRSWAHFPFSPGRFPFFYGWIVLAASVVGIVASTPGQTNGVGVFTDYLVEALGVSPLELALAYMFGTVISAFCLPYAGRMIDLWGVRIMVVFSTAGLGFSMLCIAAMEPMTRAAEAVLDTIPYAHLYAATLVSTFSFFLIRFFGQGCLTMVSRVMVGKWFNYRRGLASGVSGIFMTLGFMAGPWLLNIIVQHYGWQQTCILLAVTIGLVVGLVCWLFYRDNPEECGQVMDGITDPEWLAAQRKRAPEDLRDFTRREALRTRAFWAFTLALASQGLVLTAFYFHLTALAVEQGLTRDQIYVVMLYLPCVSIPVNVFAGYISDKIDLKWLLYVMMPTQAIGSYAVTEMGNFAGEMLMIFGYGVSGGLFGTIMTVSMPRFFGRLHLGAISGLNMSVMVLSSAVGPVSFSSIHYFTGSYREACFASMVLPLLVWALGFRVRNPQERVA